VGWGAVHALAGRDVVDAVAGLIVLSRDEDLQVRNWATFGLAQMTEIDSPASREALLARITGADPEVRGEALIGLSARGEDGVLGPLEQELRGKFHGAWTIQAADRLGAHGLLPVLVALKSRLESRDLHRLGCELDAANASCRQGSG